LDQFVDIDLAVEGLIEDEASQAKFVMPKWAYVLGVVNLLVVAESIAIAAYLPIDSTERLGLSLAHLMLGALALLVCHARASFLTMLEDVSLGVADCIAWPPRAWETVLVRLPDTRRMLYVSSAGLTAMLMSLCVIRAVPYSQLWSSDEPPPKYDSLLAKAISQAKKAAPKADPNMTLEEAIQAFSDAAEENAGLEDEGGLVSMLEKELQDMQEELLASQQRVAKTARCIIVGYSVSETNPDELVSVVLATANPDRFSSSKFIILGETSVQGQPFAAPMLEQLRATGRATPFVTSELPARWVEPRIRCEANYEEVGSEGTLENLLISKLY
jgi:hypothetical protein